MPWKNIPEVEESINNSNDREAIEKLYNLHELIASAIFPIDYQADPAYAQALIPSKHAREILASDKSIEEKYEEADVSLALIDLFYHHELLIDAAESDVDKAILLFSNELKSNRVKLPYRYGRVLYDRFNDSFNNNLTEHLEPEEVLRLIEPTEQGVYQIGNIVSGPFGILNSQESRFIPPALKLPLWHCSDTGCNKLHRVELMQVHSDMFLAYRSISQAASDLFGPDSEWQGVFPHLHREGLWPEGKPFTDISSLIGDTILAKERANLLTHAISSNNGSFLRAELSKPPRKRNAGEGSAEQIAERLSDAERLQLLFLLKDVDLVRLVDKCVANSLIRIPANEVREARNGSYLLSNYDKSCELSLYGVRSTTDEPLVSLASSVWSAYEKNNNLDELAWRCNKSQGEPNKGIITEYIRTHTPQEVISNLVLPSRNILHYLVDKFEVHLISGEAESIFIERILWKIGFDSARYENEYSQFTSRVIHFNETLLRVNSVKDEADREVLRSAGVNLFVSLEHILEEIVSYNMWLLSSDHFLDTKFRFNILDATKRVGEVLGKTCNTCTHSVTWNEKGGNTLGVLLVYLSAAAEWISLLATRDKLEAKRRDDDLPHFVEHPERIFPFLHTELWADSSQEELNMFSTHFGKVTKLFLSSSLAEIRNGLDHKRTDVTFPDIDSMLACCARLVEAFNLADIKRLIPKTYWLNSRRLDIYGREQLEALDYLKRPINLYGPSEMIGLPRVKFDKPAILPSGNLLGMANAEISFGMQEASVYSDYWQGYPRRRFIPEREDGQALDIAEEKLDNA